jgi:hypothetical protein
MGGMKTAASVCLLALAAFTARQPPPLPDPKLTPGAVRTADAALLCRPGYARSVRRVSRADKAMIYREYGIRHRAPYSFEVDHLVPLEIGGSNRRANLWPESYLAKPWNAHVKDRLEDWLHRQVCAGHLPLAQAQHEIATDWIAAYRRYLGDPSATRSVRRHISAAGS